MIGHRDEGHTNKSSDDEFAFSLIHLDESVSDFSVHSEDARYHILMEIMDKLANTPMNQQIRNHIEALRHYQGDGRRLSLDVSSRSTDPESREMSSASNLSTGSQSVIKGLNYSMTPSTETATDSESREMSSASGQMMDPLEMQRIITGLKAERDILRAQLLLFHPIMLDISGLKPLHIFPKTLKWIHFMAFIICF